MSAILTCALVFSMNGAPAVPPVPQPLQFKQVEQSKNLSQLLRSNADHCWTYNRDPRVLKNLVNYLDAEGTISGDPHLGNMTVIPVKAKGGQVEMRFLNVDFDDGGRGPFVLEFARFVTVAKASSKDIKLKDLLESYVQGLRGQAMATPKRIVKAQQLPFAEYEQMREDYVAKRMLDGHFKYKPGEIERFDGHPNIQDVKPFFKGSRVIEVAQRPMERGGSLGGVRLWVLTQDGAGSYHIFELKQYMDTALSEYSRQAGPRERIDNLHEVYWRGLDPSAYDIAEIGGTTFWIREKKVEVLTYKDRNEEDQGRIYIANIIGLTQASQADGARLLSQIERDPRRFKDAIKQYVRDYLGLADEAMD